ncbi:MAG: hypothetical protein IPG50_32060 [Myxococcales bacterium]|nr:hypothetical protein [Myxococcales bacterium]
MRSSVLALYIALAAACATAGCDDEVEPTKSTPSTDAGSDSTVTPPGDAGGGDVQQPNTDGGDGGTGPIEFTDYVKDLILNKTADNSTPDDPETKTFKDSEDPNAFPGTFF